MKASFAVYKSGQRIAHVVASAHGAAAVASRKTGLPMRGMVAVDLMADRRLHDAASLQSLIEDPDGWQPTEETDLTGGWGR